MIIGVLALQGSFAEHIEILKKLNVTPKEIRLPEDLEYLNGLIIPGGESTTMGKLMKEQGLDKKIIEEHKKGMGIMGTCAGAILLAKNGSPYSLSLIDIKLKRNAYGRQLDSFNAMINMDNVGDMEGVFIRAPKVESNGKNIKVLGRYDGEIIAAQENNILITTFHPELSNSTKVHEYFASLLKN